MGCCLCGLGVLGSSDLGVAAGQGRGMLRRSGLLRFRGRFSSPWMFVCVNTSIRTRLAMVKKLFSPIEPLKKRVMSLRMMNPSSTSSVYRFSLVSIPFIGAAVVPKWVPMWLPI